VTRSSGLVLGGLLVLLVAGAVLLAPPSNDAGPSFRIAGRGPYGLSGVAAGLRAAGMHVEERDKPTLGQGLAVIIDPHGVTSDEASSWMRSLRNGATLLYAPEAPDPFTRQLGLSFTAGGDASPAAGAAAFPDANVQFTDLNLQLSSRAAMRLPQGATNVYATDAGNSVAAVIAVGRGSVWVFADPVWFTNLAAVQVGLPVLLPLAQSAGGTVSVDTYHQSTGGRLDVLPYMPSWARSLAAWGRCVRRPRRRRATSATSPRASLTCTPGRASSGPSPARWRTPSAVNGAPVRRAWPSRSRACARHPTSAPPCKLGTTRPRRHRAGDDRGAVRAGP